MLNPNQMAQAKQTIETLSALIRELPLREYLVQMKQGDPSAATVAALIAVQKTMPPVNPSIHRG